MSDETFPVGVKVHSDFKQFEERLVKLEKAVNQLRGMVFAKSKRIR